MLLQHCGDNLRFARQREGIEVPRYLIHSPAILPLPCTRRPRSCLSCRAIPAHTPSVTHGSSRLQLLLSPSPFHRSPFNAHTHDTHGRTPVVLLLTTAMTSCLRFCPCTLPQDAGRHLLHLRRLAAARLTMLGSRPRYPVTTFLTHARSPWPQSRFFMNANFVS